MPLEGDFCMDACAVNGFFAPAQRERYLAAISRRRSVRAYQGGPAVDQLSALNYAAARLALPGVRLVLAEAEEGALYRHLPFVEAIHGTRRYAAVISDESVPHSDILAGISGEALVLEATALGLGSCWVAAFKKSGADIALEEGEKLRAVIALGAPGEGGSPRKRKKLTEICSSDPASWPLWAYNAAECVRIAPSAVNLQPWRLSFAGRTLMLSCTRGSAPLDMGIAALHMTLGVGDKPHVLRWGEGKEIISLIAEDRL